MGNQVTIEKDRRQELEHKIWKETFDVETYPVPSNRFPNQFSKDRAVKEVYQSLASAMLELGWIQFEEIKNVNDLIQAKLDHYRKGIVESVGQNIFNE